MCVILIGRITRQQHELAKKQNPDGFSMFTEASGLVKAPKDWQVNAGLGQFGIWHYRIGTSGRMDKSNIHPFRVCKGKYLLYHNGVLGAGLGEMSDTRALAETLYDLSLTTIRTVLESLKERQRFVLVDAKDPTKFELFGAWSCESGVLMSHKLYTPVTTSTKTYKSLSQYSKGGCDYED
nr:MAG TPA: YafJ-type amidotransferase class-II [Caudoviricetes sp.]